MGSQVISAACLQHTDQDIRRGRRSETQRLVRQLHALDGALETLHSQMHPISGEQLVRMLRQVQVCATARLRCEHHAMTGSAPG